MDALSAIVTLLKPRAIGSKIIHGAGRWGVRYPAFGHPSFALVLKGSCRLEADPFPVTLLEQGDFVLFPAMPGFTMASGPDVKPHAMTLPPSAPEVEEVFYGDTEKEADISMLGGYFALDPQNAPMLLSLLPGVIHIRPTDTALSGIAPIVRLIQREAGKKQDGRTLMLAHLIEVLFIEAMRSVRFGPGQGGLLAGLRNPRLAAALRGIHTRTADPWTLATLAREAGMSRSSFAESFVRTMGVTPLKYLLQWRLAVARDLLANGQKTVEQTALAVGYESASGFSTAFSRETGQPPREFVRASTRHRATPGSA